MTDADPKNWTPAHMINNFKYIKFEFDPGNKSVGNANSDGYLLVFPNPMHPCLVPSFVQVFQSYQSSNAAKHGIPFYIKELEEIGLEKGFLFVESGPLVRSSYHAEKHVK